MVFPLSLSDVSLETAPQDILVVDKDVKKCTKQTNMPLSLPFPSSSPPIPRPLFSDSPQSTASSGSLSSLANQGQGHIVSRSVGSAASHVSPPPPSPSSMMVNRYSNGFSDRAEVLSHATSDHVRHDSSMSPRLLTLMISFLLLFTSCPLPLLFSPSPYP